MTASQTAVWMLVVWPLFWFWMALRLWEAEASSTAFVRIIGFSKPMITTKNGRPSDSKIKLMGTPNLWVVKQANKNAKPEEKRTDVASQKFEPRRRIDRKSEMNVECIERYPKAMIAISIVSAFYTS